MSFVPAALCARVERVIEETGFSGVVLAGHLGRPPWVLARGLADRSRGVVNTPVTRFALASGTKTLTALAVMSLIADGRLTLETLVRDVLDASADVAPCGVTVRQLLAHTSGMGDYLDESVITDIESYTLGVPVGELRAPADYMRLLRGRSPKFAPGAGFAYCNSGYVLLARLIEVVSGRPYHEVVQQRVCAPAGAPGIAFFRLDELPRSAAIGYLPSRGWCTNQHQLPVRGAGDGGAYATAADISCVWSALFAGRVVPAPLVEEMLRPQHEGAPGRRSYGLGVWLARDGAAVLMEGSDAGISFRSTVVPSTGWVCTVMSNTTRGAWPVAGELDDALAELQPR